MSKSGMASPSGSEARWVMVAKSLDFSVSQFLVHQAERVILSSQEGNNNQTKSECLGFPSCCGKEGQYDSPSSLPLLLLPLCGAAPPGAPVSQLRRLPWLEHGGSSCLLGETTVPSDVCGLFVDGRPPSRSSSFCNFFLPSAESQSALLLVPHSQQLFGGGALSPH